MRIFYNIYPLPCLQVLTSSLYEKNFYKILVCIFNQCLCHLKELTTVGASIPHVSALTKWGRSLFFFLSYYAFFCHVWLLSSRSMLFSLFSSFLFIFIFHFMYQFQFPSPPLLLPLTFSHHTPSIPQRGKASLRESTMSGIPS